MNRQELHPTLRERLLHLDKCLLARMQSISRRFSALDDALEDRRQAMLQELDTVVCQARTFRAELHAVVQEVEQSGSSMVEGVRSSIQNIEEWVLQREQELGMTGVPA